MLCVRIIPAGVISTRVGRATPCRGHNFAHYSGMPATLGFRTRDSSQDDGLDPLHYTARIASKSLQITAVHCLKTSCLESGLLLEFVMSATILEQPIKVPITIIHSILNMQRNMTQDSIDKILLPFFHSKYFCCCSRDVTMLMHCAAIILHGEGESVSPRD
jgi:hypothetical protein